MPDRPPVTVHKFVYWMYPLFEWVMAFAMVGIALCIFWTPKTIEMGAFRFLIQAGFTAWPTFFLFAIAGGLRMVALVSNGRWQGKRKLGAKSRAVGAAFGAMLWGNLAIALVLLTQDTETASIGIPVYAALTVGELISCYRISFVYDRRLEILAGAVDARSNFSK